MGLITLPIGASNSGTNDWSDVHGEDQAIVDQVNGNLVNANLSGSAGITDANLASPNNSTYKTLLEVSAIHSGGSAAVYLLSDAGTTLLTALASGVPAFIYFDNDDFTVGAKTQKLRLRAQVAANAVAEAGTFTFGLYPITVAGSSGNIVFTAGTVVTGSTVALAAPATSTITSGVTSDFTIPSDGAYAIAVDLSSAMDAGAVRGLSAQLQTRNV